MICFRLCAVMNAMGGVASRTAEVRCTFACSEQQINTIGRVAAGVALCTVTGWSYNHPKVACLLGDWVPSLRITSMHAVGKSGYPTKTVRWGCLFPRATELQ
jgi:hypothetical protein